MGYLHVFTIYDKQSTFTCTLSTIVSYKLKMSLSQICCVCTSIPFYLNSLIWMHLQIELWPSTRSGEVGLTGQNFSSKNTVNEREVTAKDTMDEREVTVKDNMDEREVTVEDNMDEKEVIVNDSMHEIEVTVKENINEREVTVKDSMDEREVTVKDSMDEREVPVKDNMDERKVTVKDNMDEREVTVKDSMDEREVPVKDNMDERVIACNLCNQTFTNQHHLRLHKVSVHEVLKICGICGYRSYRDSIQAHIRQNHPEAYKCELSAKWFSRLYSLNRHKKAKHYPKDTKVEREITENKKTKVTKMVSSARKTSDKTGKEEQRFRCERCPKAFNSNLGLAVHRSFHTTNNQSGCAICKQMLPTSSDVLSHSCVKRNIPSGCAICKEILPTSRDVLSHSCVKSGILPKACAKCCEVLFTPFDLKFHTCTTKKHNLNKACFVCGICRVSYPTQGQLLGHMGLHTGETTLECTVCRVGFTSVDSLEKHACLGPVRKN